MKHDIDLTKTIAQLVAEEPQLLDFLTSNGFEPLKNPIILKTMGKTITLETALKKRKIDSILFIEKMYQFLDQIYNNEDKSLNETRPYTRGDLDIKGVLPCPIHMPLEDTINTFIANLEKKENITISCDLRSANLGVDWIQDEPDLITSAGFEFFFSEDMKNNYLKTGIYSGGNYPCHEGFKKLGADLFDPKHYYHILGIVPAIFIINKPKLNGRVMPTSWKDLLDPIYEQSISIPKGDLDLYNAITLTMCAKYGKDSVEKLGKATIEHLHPSQVVAPRQGHRLPLVSVVPYFFAQMIMDPNLEMVWPTDGAIASPIFMIAKMDHPHVKTVTDFLCSNQVSSILSLGGKFPSTCATIPFLLADDQPIMFAGFDFLHEHNIGKLLDETDHLFQHGMQEAHLKHI